MDAEIVIKVEKVYKDFILPHERIGTVKGMFTSMFSKATKKKETQHALKNISIEIKKGEFFGIVGRNGSGKSTLLKILAGIYQPTKGNVHTEGKLVPFIELGVGFNPELSGRDNVYLNGAMLGFSVKEVDSMYDDIVEFAELRRFMDQKLKNYSSGMQVRLAFSMATRAKADILLIDEVLAVGDADFQRKCFQYFHQLKKNNKTVVFVSHDMDGIRQYCDKAVLIENSEIQAIGSGDEISALYTKQFIDQPTSVSSKPDNDKRWGDGTARIKNVKVEPALVSDDTKLINISWQVIAKSQIDNPLHGFSIKDPNGSSLVGTNTVISKIKAIPIEKGKTVFVEWSMANVFSEGIYSVVPAIGSKDNTVHDWWEEAAIFEVRRSLRNPYPFQPELHGKVSQV